MYDRTTAAQKKREVQQRWREKNPNYTRNYMLVYRNGISLEEYEERLAEQDGKCAICQTMSPGGRSKHFHIDHDHRCCPDKKRRLCGRCIRALLCWRCNIVMGLAEDDTELLRHMIAYLEQYRMREPQ